MNKQHFCTPIPARRISTNGKLELCVVSQVASMVKVEAQIKDECVDCGVFVVKPSDERIMLYPNINVLIGKLLLKVSFISEIGEVLDSVSFPYEIVSSLVNSSRLIDGCWISIYHWSESESRHFNTRISEFTDSDWKQHIYDMHEIGITGVVIQNVFDSFHYVCQHDMTAETYRGKSFYPSELYPERLPLMANDPIEAVLSAADECGMTVFPGVGLYAWFDFSPESLKWHIEVTKELHKKYGHHPSFYGWYISEEIFGTLYYGYDAVPDENYKDIIHFFKEYSQFVHKLTPTKPIALAPSNYGIDRYKEQWTGILQHIDILLPFGFAHSEFNISEIYAICKKSKTHFWVDMEIFKASLDNGLIPKSYDDLMTEILQYDQLEQIYGYQYTGLMNPQGKGHRMGGANTEELYTRYQEYYKNCISK